MLPLIIFSVLFLVIPLIIIVFSQITVRLFLSQPGEDLFPEDEHGNALLDTVDICATWEVSSWKRDSGGAERGKPGHAEKKVSITMGV